MVVVQVVLEAAGVVSILPFMQLLADKGGAAQSRFVAIKDLFHLSSERSLILTAGILVFLLIVLANAIGLLTNWYKLKFTWNTTNTLNKRLLKLNLKQDYAYFLNRNTADLKSYILGEVNTISTGIILPCIDLVSRVCLTLLLVVVIVAVDFQVALSLLLLLGGAYAIIYWWNKKQMEELGERRLSSNLQRFRSLNDLFHGIKTVFAYQKEAFFVDRFEQANDEFTSIQPKFHILRAAPNYFLQILAFGSIIIIVLYFYFKENDLSAYLPVLSLFAYAGYRLLPNMQKSFAALATIKNNKPVFDRLHPELKQYVFLDEEQVIATSQKPLAFTQSIQFADVSFRFEGVAEKTLDGLNLSLEKGKHYAIVGSTGAGKTTLVDIFTRIHKETSGSIVIDGQPLTEENQRAFQQTIAYVPQDVFLFDDSITANITFKLQLNAEEEQRLDQALAAAEIGKFIASLPAQKNTQIGERGVKLSGGQRQRLGLARALYHQPQILVLDEATSAVDKITEENIINAIQNLPKELTVIIIAHRLSTVQHVDQIFYMEEGKIAASGSFSELQDRLPVFKELVAKDGVS